MQEVGSCRSVTLGCGWRVDGGGGSVRWRKCVVEGV